MKLQLQGLLVLWIICMTNGAPYSSASYNPNYNTASENTRPSNVNVNPPRAEAIDPNLVFGFPSNPNIHPQMPPQQIPLDIPRLPDNRQAFPATPNQGGGSYYNPGLYPAPTPPPNVFGPFRNKNVEKSTEPSLLDQFLYNKSPRNLSTINNANLNLTLFSLLFLLIYRIRNNLA
ncbi:CLUMA_CG017332, isoform C [Clunio marinus]|uniref:CLUMA_CG017332, isoform C n=1 Tax=Clunio marinus TaxID=568069 RepID=A0A1J1IYK5_9DIPT|nr:CLUMA_CG017332, isoform C [Clunio marinus]